MLKKLSFGLALTAAFGLMACSDSSSGGDGGTVTISCKVLKDKPLTIKSSEGPFSGTITYDLNKDGKVVETYEISSEAVAKDECEEMEKDEMYGEVTCTGKKIVGVYSEAVSEDDFQEFVEGLKEECIESDGKTVKLDDDGALDLDDDDDDGDGGEFLPNKPSCEFDDGDDEWGYSYSTGKDASGTSSATDVEYRIDGKDYVQVTTIEFVGPNVKLACSSAKEADGEDKDEEMYSKRETTCTDDGMITKITTIDYGYMEEHTKEQVVKGIKAACEAI